MHRSPVSAESLSNRLIGMQRPRTGEARGLIEAVSD
jgi:hypothetical protein